MCVCVSGGCYPAPSKKPMFFSSEPSGAWDVRDGGGPAPTLTGTCPHPQIIAFDELRTDFKNPIDQGNPARAVSDTCAVLRCVRLFVFLSRVEGGNGGREDGGAMWRAGDVTLSFSLSPFSQTPGAGSGLGFLLVGQPFPGSRPLPWRCG